MWLVYWSYSFPGLWLYKPQPDIYVNVGALGGAYYKLEVPGTCEYYLFIFHCFLLELIRREHSSFSYLQTSLQWEPVTLLDTTFTSAPLLLQALAVGASSEPDRAKKKATTLARNCKARARRQDLGGQSREARTAMWELGGTSYKGWPGKGWKT